MKFNPNQAENLIATGSPAGSLIRLLVQYRKWWLIPTLCCTFAALAIAVLSKNQYSSRQTLVVRDDLAGSAFKPGRFESLESMKSAQETILEIARRPQVIRSALNKLGPPRGKSGDWINDEVVEETQGRIKISAPNGAEFGATEAIVLTVEQHTRERSRDFISSLLDEIESSLRDFRSNRFNSMQQELAEASKFADESYIKAAKNLKDFEAELGPDLGTLISLGDKNTGSSNGLQNQLSTLLIEQRTAQTDVDIVGKQIEILGEVSNDPRQILEVPTELLQLLPTLDSLAKGLNEALLKYSISIGKYSDLHPSVKSNKRAVENVKMQIRQKLADSIASLEYQKELRLAKLHRIDDLIAANRRRLSELSRMRVDYETLRNEVFKKAEVKGKAEEKLADIQTLGATAHEVNLFTRVDEPQVDVNPAGPSKKLIVLGGLLSGLFIGVGLVMLVAPVDQQFVMGQIPSGPSTPTRTDPNSTQQASSPLESTSQDHSASDSSPKQPPVSVTTKDKNLKDSSHEQRRVAKEKVIVSEQNANRRPANSTSQPASSSSVTPPAPIVPTITPGSPPQRSKMEVKSSPKAEPNPVSTKNSPASLSNKLGLDQSAQAGPGLPSNLPISEKIRQIEQAELKASTSVQSKKQPINAGVTSDISTASVLGTSNQSGMPLTTSKINSSAPRSGGGNESDPRGEQKPDNRPAASQVSLQRLRQQLEAKRPELKQISSKSDASALAPPAYVQDSSPAVNAPPTNHPTPQGPDKTIQLGTELSSKGIAGNQQPQIAVPSVQAKQMAPPDDIAEDSLVVDKHIADLANSIRDMCKPTEKKEGNQ